MGGRPSLVMYLYGMRSRREILSGRKISKFRTIGLGWPRWGPGPHKWARTKGAHAGSAYVVLSTPGGLQAAVLPC